MANLPKITLDTFQALVLEADTPVLVDFGADWCPPCRAMAPILEAVNAERDDVRIVNADTDTNPGLAARHQVMGLPTMILFHHGAELTRIRGAVPRSRLLQALEPHLSTSRHHAAGRTAS